MTGKDEGYCVLLFVEASVYLWLVLQRRRAWKSYARNVSPQPLMQVRSPLSHGINKLLFFVKHGPFSTRNDRTAVEMLNSAGVLLLTRGGFVLTLQVCGRQETLCICACRILLNMGSSILL